MLLALDDKQQYQYASPEQTAICPVCNDEVISKCGDINIWHWAHKSNTEYTYHGEPETEWHLQWKRTALNAGLKIEQALKSHIYDAFDPARKIFYEFQHSAISPSDIKDRSVIAVNSGYLIYWIFDVTYKRFRFTEINDSLYNLKNKWHKKTINCLFDFNLPQYGKVYFDLFKPSGLFEIKKMYENGNGYGSFLGKDALLITGGHAHGF